MTDATSPAPQKTPARPDRGNVVAAGIIGGIIALGAFGALIWNEMRAASIEQTLSEGSRLVQEAAADRVHAIQDGKLVHVAAPALIADTLVDPEFPMFRAAHAAVLRRIVETYSWHEQRHNDRKSMNVEFIYSRYWSESVEDSSQFHERSGHENPEPEFMSAEQTGADVRVGARHVSAAVLHELPAGPDLAPTGALPPGAQLHDGILYLGARPESPQVGDQRLRWTAVQPAALSVVASQQGVELVPYRATTGRDVALIAPGMTDAATMLQRAQDESDTTAWEWRGGITLFLFGGFVMLLLPFGVRHKAFPLAGQVAGAGVVLASLGLTTIVASLVVASALLSLHHLAAGAAMLAACLFGWLVLRINRRRQLRRQIAVATPA